MTAPPRKAIRRMSEKKLKALGGKAFSTISKRSESPRKVNPEATRKRRLRNQKRMRSPEYKAARAGAMERSGGRCEFVGDLPTSIWTGGFSVPQRCPETERLQFHEERYRKVGPVRAEDGKIYCIPHHAQAEKKKMHKWGKRGFA